MVWKRCSRLALCAISSGMSCAWRLFSSPPVLHVLRGCVPLVMLMNLSPSRLAALMPATESTGISAQVLRLDLHVELHGALGVRRVGQPQLVHDSRW